MITPTKKDIGRQVTYKLGTDIEERGIITSFNEYVVFVRYGSDAHSKATHKKDLVWG